MAGLLDAIAGSNDPSTADPATGLLESQRHQLAFNALGQTGALLLAAGQPMMPGQNANILAQLGNVGGNVQTQASQMGQMNAQNQRTVAMQRQNQQQEELRQYMATPEFESQFAKMPPAQKAVIKAAALAGDTGGILKALQEAHTATQPKFTPDGGIYSPTTGDYFHPLTGVRYNVNAQQAQGQGTPSGPGPSDIHGEDFLKTLPPSMAATVKGIAEGRMPMPTGQIMRTGYGQALMQHLSQYEPGFEGTNYGARAATAKDFSAGKSAQNISALNTAISHLGTLHDSAKKLDNVGGLSVLTQPINMVKNAIANTSGEQQVNNFALARNAVADELSRAFKGANLSDTEVKAWKETISAAQSPEQLQGGIEQAIDLLHGRLGALQDQYKRGGFGKEVDFLSPKARATLDYVKTNPLDQRKTEAQPQQGVTVPAQGSGGPPASPAGPSRAEVEAELRRRGVLK